MKAGEYLTGLLHVEQSQREFHDINATPDAPLNSVAFEALSPGSKALEKGAFALSLGFELTLDALFGHSWRDTLNTNNGRIRQDPAGPGTQERTLCR